MQHQSPESLRAWFKGVEPICAELFNAAHAMCGNYDLAEYALRSAILDVWLENAGAGMGLRERLRAALRREAIAVARSEEGAEAEFTWAPPSTAPEGDAILTQFAQESARIQRLAMLRYGCALPPHAISQLTDLGQRQVRSELDRFEARCRRRLPRQARARTEALIAQRVKRLLSQDGPGSPQPSQVFRAFEAEVEGARQSGHRFTRVAGAAVSVLFALLCAGAFWLFAVLAQPV